MCVKNVKNIYFKASTDFCCPRTIVYCCVCKSALSHTLRVVVVGRRRRQREEYAGVFMSVARRVCAVRCVDLVFLGAGRLTLAKCALISPRCRQCVYIFSLADVYHTHAHHMKHAFAFALCTFLMLCPVCLCDRVYATARGTQEKQSNSHVCSCNNAA